jgi:hypothetical protein
MNYDSPYESSHAPPGSALPQEPVRQSPDAASESTALNTISRIRSTADTAANDGGGSRLLRLPAELRNLIYEYALTADTHQLYYRDAMDPKGVPTEITENINGVSITRKITYDERVVTLYKSVSADGVKLCLGSTTTTDFNQLKYVCKQLYSETKRLPLQYNDAIFAKDDQYPQDQTIQFLRFLHQCHKTWTSKVRTVIINTSKPRLKIKAVVPRDPAQRTEDMLKELAKPAHHLNQLADFCTANPGSTVRNHIDYLHGVNGWCKFWTYMLALRSLFQRPVPRELYGDETTTLYSHYVEGPTREGRVLGFRLSSCANFGMFPHREFDELEFRRQMNEDVKMQVILIPLVNGGLDTWVKEAKRIFKEGF